MQLLVSSLLTLIGLAGIGAAIRTTNLFWLIALVPFGILLLLVAPYRMWKEENKAKEHLGTVIQGLTTPQLIVTQGLYNVQQQGYFFYTLEVTNPTGIPIPGVYGDLTHARVIFESQETKIWAVNNPTQVTRSGLPPDSHKYPWSWTKGSRTETIPPKGSRHLYVLARQEGSVSFSIPTEDGPAYQCYLPGEIEFLIAIGSEVQSFPPTKVRVVIDGAQNHLWKSVEVLS